MRRLSLRAVVAVTAPVLFASPAALAQYDRRGNDMPAAIAIFSDENYYGDVRDIYDPFDTLTDIRFNDKARSVAVFAGQWELCEHKNFTGRCVFIKEDVSDLGWFGLNGRITSVRPVYEYTEASHGLMFSRDKYGYIRYADDEIYGYDTWEHGYASSWGLSVSHFGFSPDYYRYGYYSPSWGYDPYGFAWGPRGRVRYSSSYRYHPRPSVINPYWIGWDWSPSDWRHGTWSWRGNDWDDWRRDRRGHPHRDGDGRDGRDHPGDRPGRDRPGDGWGPGDGGVRPVLPPATDPGSGRGSRRGGDTVRDPVSVDPIPVDPRPGRSGRGGPGSWTPPADPGIGPGIGSVPPVSDPPQDPWPGRGDRRREPSPDTSGLLGGTVPDGPRGGGDDWRRRGGDDERRGSRFGGDMSGGGPFGTAPERPSEPAFVPPPPPPPMASQPSWDPPPDVSRSDSSSDDEGGRRGRGEFRRRGGDE